MKSKFLIFTVIFASVSSTEGDRKQTESSENANNRVFAAHTYFDINDKPVLANGHVGYVPFGDSIYMNGLYEWARIPNFANIYFDSCGSAHTANKSRCSYKMDAQRALFQTKANIFGGNVTVEHIQYAHRYFDRVIVNTIELVSKYVVANESFRLNINREWNGWSADLKLGDVITGKIADREVVLIAATTQSSEDPIYQSELSKVFILYERIPKSIQIPSGQLSVSFTWLTIIQHTHTADDMEELFQRLHAISADDLLKSHTREWNDFWEENGISVHGNDELSKSIQSSLYAISSSLPSLQSLSENGPFYGLSPSGLGIGGPKRETNEGHSFSETWILPAVLAIEPKWSEKILNYRHIVREAAHDNAQNAGNEGLRFSWESAFTGVEAAPEAKNHDREHITADIGSAVRAIFFATHDLNWMKDYGCDLAIETARFWASRVAFNKSANHFDINGVIGPNEGHSTVNNNPFTNVAAALNLYFGTYASCICRKLNASKYSFNERWSEIASQIRLLHDPKLDYNPQYEGYNLSIPIERADVALLGYPLQYSNINQRTRRNNLKFYKNVTSSRGLATTWSMHAIAYLDLGMTPSRQLFNRSHVPYIRKPFYVWNESDDGTSPGTSNFLSGAGGFLQLIIYGYAGVRIRTDCMKIKHPTLPPRTRKLKLKGLSYMGLRFSLEIARDFYRIALRGDSSNVVLYVDDVEQDISTRKRITLSRTQSVKIFPKETENIGRCPLPRDIIDQA